MSGIPWIPVEEVHIGRIGVGAARDDVIARETVDLVTQPAQAADEPPVDDGEAAQLPKVAVQEDPHERGPLNTNGTRSSVDGAHSPKGCTVPFVRSASNSTLPEARAVYCAPARWPPRC